MRSRPMRPRMRSTAMLAGMNCPRSFRARRGVGRGWRESSRATRSQIRDDKEAHEPAAEHEFDQARIVAPGAGPAWGGCLKSKRQLDQDRWRNAAGVPRSRSAAAA